MKLAAAREIALDLPEVSEAPHHHMGSWRVRGKIFATIPPPGPDGEELLHVFVDEALREQLLAREPAVYEPLLWGGKPCGVRVRLAGARAGELSFVLKAAWAHKAPPAARPVTPT